MSETIPGWAADLRKWRRAEGLSRAEMASRTGLSAETIKAYEIGRRKATRETLAVLATELKLDRSQRNAIFEDAGYATDSELLRPTNEDNDFTLTEAQAEIDRYAWPAHVNNDLMEVLATNAPARSLWRNVGPEHVGEPVESNVMTLASDPNVGGRIKNWDEVVGVGIGIMKGHLRGAETRPEGSSAYFGAVMKRYLQGAPEFVAGLLRLWESVEPRSPKRRWTVPVELDHPEAGLMHFEWASSICSERDGLYFMDWIPVDAATWAALERLKGG